MTLPTCNRCGETVGWLIGLPVWVDLGPGQVTLSVDLSELADSDGQVTCRCEGQEPDLTTEDQARLGEILHHSAGQDCTVDLRNEAAVTLDVSRSLATFLAARVRDWIRMAEPIANTVEDEGQRQVVAGWITEAADLERRIQDALQ